MSVENKFREIFNVDFCELLSLSETECINKYCKVEEYVINQMYFLFMCVEKV